ncbi:LCP family protein [Micromonospora sp. NPDC050397]|uniref:LCP family protein n=1 Tax=Micromonospora sp. NPDC050397 TaxID=3364279 RepID=UPI00384AC96B
MAGAGQHRATGDGPDARPGRTAGGWRSRRRITWAAGIVVGVLLVAGAAVITNTLRGPGGSPSAERDATSGSVPLPPTASPTPSPTPEPGADVKGPLNLLLVGVDTRVSEPDWEPHADAVLIMHVAETLDRAYLFSLPRDLVVDVPPFAKARFPGERTKLTHAMSYGSRVSGGKAKPSTKQGLELVEATVSRYTGIAEWDASAVLTFGGFDNLVDALGGIDLYVDQQVASQHRQPDGRHRPGNANGDGYAGPQMVYETGNRHLTGWQALDYARQRYTTGGDYARQRHQQQLIKAIVAKVVSEQLARDPDRLDQVLRALGEALTFSGRDQRVVDFAFALSGLRPETITLVGLPGASVGSGGSYLGEQLTQVGTRFLTELRAGRADAYLAANPELVVTR